MGGENIGLGHYITVRFLKCTFQKSGDNKRGIRGHIWVGFLRSIFQKDGVRKYGTWWLYMGQISSIHISEKWAVKIWNLVVIYGSDFCNPYFRKMGGEDMGLGGHIWVRFP